MLTALSCIESGTLTSHLRFFLCFYKQKVSGTNNNLKREIDTMQVKQVCDMFWVCSLRVVSWLMLLLTDRCRSRCTPCWSEIWWTRTRCSSRKRVANSGNSLLLITESCCTRASSTRTSSRFGFIFAPKFTAGSHVGHLGCSCTAEMLQTFHSDYEWEILQWLLQ